MAIDLKHNGNIEVTNGVITIDGNPVGGGGGLEGTQYVFVTADGTDVENSTELQSAYDTAKNLVSVITSLSDNILSGTSNISAGQNTINPIESVGNIPLGLNNFEVISDSGTEILQFDVLNYLDGTGIVFDSTVSRTNVTSLKFQDVTVKRATVIASPSYYNFSSDFVMDEEYVDLVSLDGNKSVVFNGTGTISITANDVFVKGVDVGTKNFTIATNLNLLRVENCKGGNFSFGGDTTFGSNPINVSGTFTNCQGGDDSFGRSGTASGTFTNCQGGDDSFGRSGTASGTFTNCQGDGNSFGTSGTASGTFTNCQGGGGSFGTTGTASGTFTNCVGGNISFGGGGTASGTFTNCQGGDNSFGRSGGTLEGKLYYCRLTTGTFQTVSGDGLTRLCIDGNNDENNQG